VDVAGDEPDAVRNQSPRPERLFIRGSGKTADTKLFRPGESFDLLHSVRLASASKGAAGPRNLRRRPAQPA